jgi:hypothetical protein
MDEKLERYLINYFGHFMTREERAARYSFILEEKAQNGPEGHRAHLLSAVSTDPAVLKLMKDGYEAFASRVVERLMRERRRDIFLNNCPKCGALARTPTAKQCPACFHSWHDVE